VRSRTRWFFCLSALAGMLTQARAQQAPLTLDDCINLALKAPSAVSVAESQQAAAAEAQTIARGALLPQLSYQGGFVYNSPIENRPQPFSFVALNGVREYLSAIDSTWEIDLSGRLRAGMALARAQRDIAGADLKLARRELRRAVAVAFYDVLLTRSIVDLEQQGVNETREFEGRTRARQRQGEASMADVHRAAAQRARFEQRLSQANLNARLANQILASFWTTDVDRPLTLAAALENAPPLPPAIAGGGTEPPDTAIRQRAEFERLEAIQRTFRAEHAAARAALRPQANVVFQYGIDANNARIADRGYAAFVNLSVPVFDWFQARGAARQARYREQQTEQEQTMAQRAFSREYLAAKARAESWHERTSLAQSELADSRENLRLARLLYDSGEGMALDVVTAQTEVSDAGTSYYGALAAYQRALIDFEVASGR